MEERVEAERAEERAAEVKVEVRVAEEREEAVAEAERVDEGGRRGGWSRWWRRGWRRGWRGRGRRRCWLRGRHSSRWGPVIHQVFAAVAFACVIQAFDNGGEAARVRHPLPRSRNDLGSLRAAELYHASEFLKNFDVSHH